MQQQMTQSCCNSMSESRHAAASPHLFTPRVRAGFLLDELLKYLGNSRRSPAWVLYAGNFGSPQSELYACHKTHPCRQPRFL